MMMCSGPLTGVFTVSAFAGDVVQVGRDPPAVTPRPPRQVMMCCIPLTGVLAISTFAGDVLQAIFPARRNLAAIVIPVAGTAGVAAVPPLRSGWLTVLKGYVVSLHSSKVFRGVA